MTDDVAARETLRPDPLTPEDALDYLLDAIDVTLGRRVLDPPVNGVRETTILHAMTHWPKGANGPIAVGAYEALVERLVRLRAVTMGLRSGLIDGRPFERAALRTATPDPEVCEVQHGIWTEPHDKRRCWETATRTDWTPNALRDALASYIGRSGWVRPVGDPPDHDRAWWRMRNEAQGMLEDDAIRASLAEARAALLDELEAAVRERTERHDSTHTCSSEKVHADLRACLALIQQHREEGT